MSAAGPAARIPLAIARPDMKIALLDSNHKKTTSCAKLALS